jgi:hypothetical protein
MAVPPLDVIQASLWDSLDRKARWRSGCERCGTRRPRGRRAAERKSAPVKENPEQRRLQEQLAAISEVVRAPFAAQPK